MPETITHPSLLPPRVADELEPWRGVLAGRRFVWMLAPPWHGVWTRQNHFATRLAQLGVEVLYVENPPALTSLLKQRRWSELSAVTGPRVERIEPGLHVMRPAQSLPGGKQADTIARWNGRRIAAQVHDWLRERCWTDYDCWCRLPSSLFALRELAPERTIYDVTDDYELYETNPRARRKVREREAQLIACADQVFITSEELRRKPALVAAQLAPNGVEFDLFAQANEPGEIPSLIAGLKKPIIGCVGLASPWTDFALLETLGRTWPGQVLMVGPIDARVERRARAIPGLVWAGFVKQRELPAWLRGMSLCLMPYLVNDRTVKASPLRMWEYLAAGKPVVSVDLPAARNAAGLVDVARDHEEFVGLVGCNLRECADTKLIARRQAAARAFSWDSIFAGVLERLQSLSRCGAGDGGQSS